MDVRPCDFQKIEKSWRDHLWAGRKSPIEPTSAMNSAAQIDLSVLQFSRQMAPCFWSLDDEDQVRGTISLQKTGRHEYRMRGVWLDEKMRGQGQGRKLVETLLAHAHDLGAHQVWGISRQSQLGFYQRLGFQAGAVVEGFEFGPHVLITFLFPRSRNKLRNLCAQLWTRKLGFQR
jgi:GNAT superfamily N-acetyltransferase